MTTKNLLLVILESRRESMLRQHHDRAMFTYSEIANMADMASADAAALQGAQTIAEQARNERDAAVQANERKERELSILQNIKHNLCAERDAAVKLADERLTLIVQQAEESAKDKQEIDRLNRKLDNLQYSVKHVKFQLNSLRDDLVAAQGFCDKLRGDLKAVSGQRDILEQQLKESVETETYLREEIRKLRNENSDLHNCVKTLSLKPVQYGAGGAASGCNNSIDAAKAQTSKPDFVKICRDQLDTCLRDGSWIGYAELRDYVTHTATYGEQDQ